jgi:hypothetical protein
MTSRWTNLFSFVAEREFAMLEFCEKATARYIAKNRSIDARCRREVDGSELFRQLSVGRMLTPWQSKPRDQLTLAVRPATRGTLCHPTE